MPSRQGKNLEKFGVTSQYPQLSLHSAAASGNLGLVKFALSNGQPASSILNGVLPIHAACSNGNEAIVRMLIENGADVNAPRLPRRYNNDKRVPNTVSVGTSGSTPLHFAAANGHMGIVELLLACGARPDLTEKRGLTPEALANEYGHDDVVHLLQHWDRQTALQVNRANQDSTNDPKVASLPPPAVQNPTNRLTASASLTNLRQLASQSLAHKSSSGSLKLGSNASRRTEEMQRQNSMPITYSSLTYQPNTSSASLHSFDNIRRPSLQSVFEKGSKSREVVRQALGLSQSRSSSSSSLQSKPTPLNLTESTSDAFDPSLKRRPSTSSTRAAIASVFGRNRRQSSSGSLPAHSPTDTLNDSALLSTPTSPDVGNNEIVRRRHASDNEISLSGTERALSPEHVPMTAPPNLPTFYLPPPVGSPGTDIRSQSRTSNYRPRKSSILSSREAITAAPAQSPDKAEHSDAEHEDQLPELMHSPQLLTNQHRSLSQSSSLSAQTRDDRFSSQDSDAIDLDGEAEQRSTLLHYRSLSGSRLRADSTGSAASSLSPYAPAIHSPLGSVSGDSVPSITTSSEFMTRPRRSASNSTDPDLRHLVLNTQAVNSDYVGPSSPHSTSSWSGYSPPSIHSTPATSVIHSIGSYRDQPASPRKYSNGELITPAMASFMVKEAESRLLSFNAASPSTQLSLSEQLAAYSDTLSLERELVNKPGRLQAGPRGYTFERLERGGGRTPIEVGEGQPRPGMLKNSLRGQRPFQQGVLDARRQPAPLLRQDINNTDPSSRLIVPPGVPPSWQLSAGVNKIYDNRAAALHQHRSVTPGLQYRILESNHTVPSARSTRSASAGRRSPTWSVDDPVRTSASSSGSETPAIPQIESSRPQRNATMKKTHRPQQSFSNSTEGELPPILITPTASRGEPQHPFGIEGLEIKERPKGRLARGLENFKNKVF